MIQIAYQATTFVDKCSKQSISKYNNKLNRSLWMQLDTVLTVKPHVLTYSDIYMSRKILSILFRMIRQFMSTKVFNSNRFKFLITSHLLHRFSCLTLQSDENLTIKLSNDRKNITNLVNHET